MAQVWAGLTLDKVGVAAGLAASVALAVYYLAGERLVVRRDPYSLVCFSIGAATGFWAVVQPWWSFPFAAPDRAGRASRAAGDHGARLGAGVWTIVLGTIAPFVLSIGALRHLPATTVTIVATFEPVAAAVSPGSGSARRSRPCRSLGGAVVLAGILLAETSR